MDKILFHAISVLVLAASFQDCDIAFQAAIVRPFLAPSTQARSGRAISSPSPLPETSGSLDQNTLGSRPDAGFIFSGAVVNVLVPFEILMKKYDTITFQAQTPIPQTGYSGKKLTCGKHRKRMRTEAV